MKCQILKHAWEQRNHRAKWHFGVQLHVRLSFSVSAVWQLMTRVRLYNKQEKEKKRGAVTCRLCDCQWGTTAGRAPKRCCAPATPSPAPGAAVRLPQRGSSPAGCWVPSVLLAVAITEAVRVAGLGTAQCWKAESFCRENLECTWKSQEKEKPAVNVR